MYLNAVKTNLKSRIRRSKKQENVEEEKRGSQIPDQQHAFVHLNGEPALREWNRATALPTIPSDHHLLIPFQSFDDSIVRPNGYSQDPPAIENGPTSTKIRPARLSRTVLDSISKPTVPHRAQVKQGLFSRNRDVKAQPSQLGAVHPQVSRVPGHSDVAFGSSEDEDEFDLRPPSQSKNAITADVLSDSLFSSGHLYTILRDPQLFTRFVTFLNRYRPRAVPVLISYLETQKAIKAVEYANALAESVAAVRMESSSCTHVSAAQLDPLFVKTGQKAFQELLSESLPAYITFSLVRVLTEVMVNDITGRSMPMMSGLVDGLTEIFCLTDPNKEDNPIVYASEAFYDFTGYGRDLAIGTNCRFLQGPKTSQDSVRRLREATKAGVHISETFLNYTRDGRPFINTLMIAPLHDTAGKVRYHIGAQVNVNGMVEGGRGLESFRKHLLSGQTDTPSPDRTSNTRSRYRDTMKSTETRKKALEKLDELSEMLDLDEAAALPQRSGADLISRIDDDENSNNIKIRRVIRDSASNSDEFDEQSSQREQSPWNLSRTGLSGKLPGVYESYLLMRPSPSLKIIFMSPGLRRIGDLVQTRFLSSITAPAATMKGIEQSFQSNNPVTAKVRFLARTAKPTNQSVTEPGRSRIDEDDSNSAQVGRTCWISATPLFGADDRVGVWMVIVVGKRSIVSAASSGASKAGTQDVDMRQPGPDFESLSSETKITRPSHKVETEPEEIDGNLQSTTPLRKGKKNAFPIPPRDSSSQLIRLHQKQGYEVELGTEDLLNNHLRKRTSSSSALPNVNRKHSASKIAAVENRSAKVRLDASDEDDSESAW